MFTPEGLNAYLDKEYKITQKVGEEATEGVIAALNEGDEAFKAEAADLIYHLLVLLSAKGITLREINSVLFNRHKTK